MQRITTQKDLVTLATALGVRPDWHEPDEQEVTAEVRGTWFDNAGFWDVDPERHPDADPEAQEMHVVIRVNGQEIAAVNLADVLAWAAEPRERKPEPRTVRFIPPASLDPVGSTSDVQVRSVLIDNSTGTVCLNVARRKPGLFKGQPDGESIYTARMSPADAERWGHSLLKFGAITGDRVAWDTTGRRTAGETEPADTVSDDIWKIRTFTTVADRDAYLSKRGGLRAVTWQVGQVYHAILIRGEYADTSRYAYALRASGGAKVVRTHPPLA